MGVSNSLDLDQDRHSVGLHLHRYFGTLSTFDMLYALQTKQK